jgi:beta-galactosidase
LEPAFHWSASDEYLWYKKVVVCSNCEHLKFFVGEELVADTDPNRAEFGYLRHPPFFTDLSRVEDWTADLRIEGYIGNKKVIAKSYSGKAIDQRFELRADDDSLIADEADATRVVFRVTDAYGRVRPYATAAIVLELEGPAELIGDNPFALVGGVGAVWIRARQQPGGVVLRAKHPTLGRQELKIQVGAAEVESV